MKRANSSNFLSNSGKNPHLIFRSNFLLISVALGVLQVVMFSWQTDQQKRIYNMQELALSRVFKNAQKWNTKYKVVSEYYEGFHEQLSNNTFDDVTLVTQCSVNNLRYLPEMAKRWNGPISVALFTPHDDAIQAILSVRWLRHCYPLSIKKFVSFHFVYPIKHPPKPREHSVDPKIWQFNSSIYSNKWSLTCEKVMLAINDIKGKNYMANGIPYPHNTLRNAAKIGVFTKFMFLLDIDTMPSANVRENFMKLYTSLPDDDPKTVFVAPAFEIRAGKIPRTKSQLLEEYRSENVRPFHFETCIWCHKPTRFTDWLAIPETDNLEIAYEGEWEPSWEPFYISTVSVPNHDERFQQYGYDRISQVCELSMANYKFMILNNIFVVHEGFKFPGKFHSQKDLENKRNFRIYTEVFTPEMKLKYPNSTTSCQERNRVRGKAQVKFRPHFQAHMMKKAENSKNDREL